MPPTLDLPFLDAAAQAELVRRGEVTALELVDAAISRIETLNPLLNAVVTKMYESARKVARGPLPPGPFSGVPFLLKDFLAEYEGTRLTEGSAYLQSYISEEDSDLVRRFKRAGLIVVGKSNTPEFALGVTTEPRLHGPTRNPWNITRTAGGSSGGSAAAVVSGMVPMAHGNDAGGSIRIPASCCGLFGLKPTRGRTPFGPRYGDVFGGLEVDHVLTRSVRDSAIMLDATTGSDPGAPYSAPTPERSFSEEIGADPGRLRIAFATEGPFGSELHPDCIAAVQDAAALCIDLGHEVDQASPAFGGEEVWRAFTTMLSVGFAWRVADWQQRTGRVPTPEDFEPFFWAFIEQGRRIGGVAYLSAVQVLQQMTRRVAAFFADHDVWLTPTLGEPPVPFGTFAYHGGDPLAVRRRAARFSPFTFLCNATGQPAMSVPLWWNDAGLPIGTHFVARYGDEATLFRLASQLEMARPWAHRIPAVSA